MTIPIFLNQYAMPSINLGEFQMNHYGLEVHIGSSQKL